MVYVAMVDIETQQWHGLLLPGKLDAFVYHLTSIWLQLAPSSTHCVGLRQQCSCSSKIHMQ